MTRYIETICIKNGKVLSIRYHNDRCLRTRQMHYVNAQPINLRRHIDVPESMKSGLVKCRITYGQQVEQVEYEPYHTRPIRSLKIMQADHLCYSYKTADRSVLSSLYALRGEADDILMIKNGLITDTYYANVALKKEKDWYTPAEPLLQGTRRAKLLHQQQVIPHRISVDELSNYNMVRVFNAMIPFGAIELPVSAILK